MSVFSQCEQASDYLDGEMSEIDLLEQFSQLLEDTAIAFNLQSNYATDIVLKAKTIKEKELAKQF